MPQSYPNQTRVTTGASKPCHAPASGMVSPVEFVRHRPVARRPIARVMMYTFSPASSTTRKGFSRSAVSQWELAIPSKPNSRSICACSGHEHCQASCVCMQNTYNAGDQGSSGPSRSTWMVNNAIPSSVIRKDPIWGWRPGKSRAWDSREYVFPVGRHVPIAAQRSGRFQQAVLLAAF